jgi:hypothetical protein
MQVLLIFVIQIGFRRIFCLSPDFPSLAFSELPTVQVDLWLRRRGRLQLDHPEAPT